MFEGFAHLCAEACILLNKLVELFALQGDKDAGR
jgi:hypothetical protein